MARHRLFEATAQLLRDELRPFLLRLRETGCDVEQVRGGIVNISRAYTGRALAGKPEDEELSLDELLRLLHFAVTAAFRAGRVLRKLAGG